MSSKEFIIKGKKDLLGLGKEILVAMAVEGLVDLRTTQTKMINYYGKDYCFIGEVKNPSRPSQVYASVTREGEDYKVSFEHDISFDESSIQRLRRRWDLV